MNQKREIIHFQRANHSYDVEKYGDGPVFGCDLEIQISDGPVTTETVSKHWVGSIATCVRKAALITRFKRISKIDALDRETYIRCFGNPSKRM